MINPQLDNVKAIKLSSSGKIPKNLEPGNNTITSVFDILVTPPVTFSKKQLTYTTNPNKNPQTPITIGEIKSLGFTTMNFGEPPPIGEITGPVAYKKLGTVNWTPWTETEDIKIDNIISVRWKTSSDQKLTLSGQSNSYRLRNPQPTCNLGLLVKSNPELCDGNA